MKKVAFNIIFSSIFFFLATSIGFSQALSSKQIDSLVEKTMTTFNVPGMAVAVLKDGEVISKKGYGVQSLKTKKPVDTKTMFGVASNTKAFTSAALAQLIDQGKLEWDTKVTDIIPEFKLYNPYVTSEFTVRDLLTHRSGLGLGAGDLMIFPANNTTTKSEMIHNLRYLKPVSSFRSKFDYDNLLYIVAGEVVERVSGEAYDTYIQQHFFNPLKMDRTTLDGNKIANDANRIDGHAPVNGKLEITGATFTKLSDAAGGIYSSIDDMANWVQVRLDHGKYGSKKQDSLFSEQAHREMWTPQSILRTGKGAYNTHFYAYGLGWFLKDVNGYFQASHTGGLLGIVSQVTLIPELDLGIIVLTNQQSGAAFTAITNSIKDGYFGISDANRIKQYNESRLKYEKQADSITASVEKNIAASLKNTASKPKAEVYTGTYKDPWFGKVTVSKKKEGLYFTSEKSKDLTGHMQFYKGTTYVVRWDDTSLKADAFVVFSLDTEGRAKGFTMKPISPLTDFSYDFQDLEFKRVGDR